MGRISFEMAVEGHVKQGHKTQNHRGLRTRVTFEAVMSPRWAGVLCARVMGSSVMGVRQRAVVASNLEQEGIKQLMID